MAEDNHPILFMQLVMQNQQIAMMAMGKIKNPVTDKIDRNLEYAKVSIDTLDMLLVKTKGNITEYEEKFLTEALKDLKLNYVDEVENLIMSMRLKRIKPAQPIKKHRKKKKLLKRKKLRKKILLKKRVQNSYCLTIMTY